MLVNTLGLNNYTSILLRERKVQTQKKIQTNACSFCLTRTHRHTERKSYQKAKL